MDAKFIKGQDPRKAMDIGLSRYENTWDRIYPANTPYSPEEAIQYLRKTSLKPYIVKNLPRQPDWTIDYQVKMLNHLITHGNFAPFPEIRPEREIPSLTMRRIFDELENKGILEFDRSRKPYIVYLKDPEVNESINFERGLEPKDSLKIGHYHNRMLEKAREELKNIFGDIQKKYGGKIDVRKATFLLQTGIRATWIPPTSSYNYGIEFFESKDDNQYYFTPIKWNKPGKPFANLNYGGRKSPQEAANEIIAQWGGKIDESLDFERGLDPKASIDIGTKNRILNKLKNIHHNEIELGSKRDMQTLWGFYPMGEDYYIFSSVYPKNWIEDILKGYGIDEFLQFPGEYEEKRSAVYKIKYKIKGPFKEYFKNIGAFPNFVSEAVNFERGADPKSSMNIGSITILKNKVKIFKSYMEDPWLRLELRDENIFNILTSKTRGIKALIDYYLEKSELNTYLEDLEKSEIRKLRPNRYSASANSIDYYIKPIYKKLFKEFFDIKESHEFVRGMDPKKAMNIGKNKNNFFATIPSMPFMEACEKYPWFENLFAGEQNNLLTAAAKMLQTSEQKVGVGIWPNDPEDIPLNPNDLILDKYIERDEWNYDKEDEVGKFQLIGSSTGEIYIKNQITEDILCILGTIY